MPDTCSPAVWAPPCHRASRLAFPARVLDAAAPHPPTPPPPATKRPTTVHVLVSLKCFFSKLHILSKPFAHITAICVQGSLKQVCVWKAMESTRGSEIHKTGKAMIQREAALLCYSKLKSTQGDRAAAAYLGWFLLTWLDLVPHVWIGPPARPRNHRLPPMTEFDLYISPPPLRSTGRPGSQAAERQWKVRAKEMLHQRINTKAVSQPSFLPFQLICSLLILSIL